jgi:beta-lactamase class D
MRWWPVLMLVACSRPEAPAPGAPVPRTTSTPTPIVPTDAPPDLARVWPDGCFIFRDPSGTVRESDPRRCAEPRRPYSTFKIANALIGVDTGVLAGPDAPMTWDKQRVPDEKDWFESWRKEHTLRSATKVSSVPHFRTLALLIGADRMKAGLATLGYGNQDTSGGLDLFWLRGGLRITAAQQLALVEDLARGKLAVSAQAQAAVRDILELARSGDAVLYGKTGTGRSEDGRGDWLAWQVGWVDRAGVITPYAVWFEDKGSEPMSAIWDKRQERLRSALDALGVFPKS